MKKIDRTIALLKHDWMTSLDCANRGGVLSLSQRIGDLRDEYATDGAVSWLRYDIKEKWVKTPGGSLVKAWRITRDSKFREF